MVSRTWTTRPTTTPAKIAPQETRDGAGGRNAEVDSKGTARPPTSRRCSTARAGPRLRNRATILAFINQGQGFSDALRRRLQGQSRGSVVVPAHRLSGSALAADQHVVLALGLHRERHLRVGSERLDRSRFRRSSRSALAHRGTGRRTRDSRHRRGLDGEPDRAGPDGGARGDPAWHGPVLAGSSPRSCRTSPVSSRSGSSWVPSRTRCSP